MQKILSLNDVTAVVFQNEYIQLLLSWGYQKSSGQATYYDYCISMSLKLRKNIRMMRMKEEDNILVCIDRVFAESWLVGTSKNPLYPGAVVFDLWTGNVMMISKTVYH